MRIKRAGVENAEYTYDNYDAPTLGCHFQQFNPNWHSVCTSPWQVYAYQYRDFWEWKELPNTREFSTNLVYSAEFADFAQVDVRQRRPMYCNGEYGEWEDVYRIETPHVKTVRVKQWFLFFELDPNAIVPDITVSVSVSWDPDKEEEEREAFEENQDVDPSDPVESTNPVASNPQVDSGNANTAASLVETPSKNDRGNSFSGFVESLSTPDTFDDKRVYYSSPRTGTIDISKGSILSGSQLRDIIGGQVGGIEISQQYIIEEIEPLLERNMESVINYSGDSFVVERWKTQIVANPTQ